MAGSLAAMNDSHPLFVIFFVIHFTGWTGSFIVLLTVLLSSRVQRHITWIMFCSDWILACFSYTLLVFSGQINATPPDPWICLVQAAATSTAPTLTAGATLALALHLWFQFRDRVSSTKVADHRSVSHRNIMLVVAPHIVPLGLFIGVLVYGIHHPQKVALAGNGMVCGLNHWLPGRFAAIFTTVLMIPTVALEGIVIVSLHRDWKGSRSSGSTTTTRLVAFTCVAFFAAIVSLVYLSQGDVGRLPSVLMALPPLAFVLLFGTQMDIVGVWMFWRQHDEAQCPSSKFDEV